MQGTGLREIAIHRSLTRPQLLAGCDRGLLILLLTLCGLLIGPAGLSKGDYINVALGVIFIFLGVTCLAKMAKKDPNMRHIYMRSLKYGRYYSARPKYEDTPPPQRKRWD